MPADNVTQVKRKLVRFLLKQSRTMGDSAARSTFDSLFSTVKEQLLSAEPNIIREQREGVAGRLVEAKKGIQLRMKRPLSLFLKENYRDAAKVLFENFQSSSEKIEKKNALRKLESLWDRILYSPEENVYEKEKLIADMSREGWTRKIWKVTSLEGEFVYCRFTACDQTKARKTGTQSVPSVVKEMKLSEAKSFQLVDLYNEVFLLKQLQPSPFFLEYKEFVNLTYTDSSWLVVEYVAIGDLDTICQEVGYFNLKQAQAMAAQV